VNSPIDLHPIACFFTLSFIENLLNHHSEDIPRFDWEVVAEMDAEVVGGVVADVIGEERTGRTASRGHSPENSSMPKTNKRTETIEVQCTPEQKAQIRQYATGAGSSMSSYLLDCGLKRRRQVEGPLINLQLYQCLSDLAAALKDHPQSYEVEAILELIWEVRREVALRRIGEAAEKAI
jgi:uncharacterized protein (DUF1778 family)